MSSTHPIFTEDPIATVTLPSGTEIEVHPNRPALAHAIVAELIEIARSSIDADEMYGAHAALLEAATIAGQFPGDTADGIAVRFSAEQALAAFYQLWEPETGQEAAAG